VAALRELEILAKVSRFFIEDSIGIRLSTGVGVLGIVEDAVEAAVEIGATVGAGIAPPDAVFAVDLVSAMMARLHKGYLY
jgi:hypothetical protein